MYESMLQEMTGIKLFQEQGCIINSAQYKKIIENMEIMSASQDLIKSDKEIHEIYFNSNMEETKQEQFYLKVEKRGGRKKILLGRKLNVGGYGSEVFAKISRKQYLSILEGSIEWMKKSEKILINEFYCKLKLFQYRIEKIVRYYREEFYIKKDKLLIMLDSSLDKLYSDRPVFDPEYREAKVYLTARVSTNKNNKLQERDVLNGLLKNRII